MKIKKGQDFNSELLGIKKSGPFYVETNKNLKVFKAEKEVVIDESNLKVFQKKTYHDANGNFIGG